MSNLIKGIAILLLALSLALSLLWQRMIIIGLDSVLQGSGYQLDEIRFGTIGLSAADLPFVRLKGDAGEALEHAALEGLVFQYNLQGLWAGRLSSVSIQRTSLKFQANPIENNSPIPVTEFFQYLALTPDVIRIPQLSWFGVSGLADGQVSLQADKTGMELVGRIVDLNYPNTQAQLKLKSGQVTALDFILTDHDKPVLRVQSKISLEPDKGSLNSHGEAHLQAAEILALFSRYSVQPYNKVKDISGEFIVNWSGSVSNDLATLVQSADIDWTASIRSAGSFVSDPALNIQVNIPVSGRLSQGELILVAESAGTLNLDVDLGNELITAAHAEILLESPLQVKVGPLGSTVGVEMSGKLAISLRGDEHQSKLAIDLQQLDCKSLAVMSCHIRAALEAVADELEFGSQRLLGFRFTLSGELAINQEEVSFLIDSGARASLQALYLGESELHNIQIKSGSSKLKFDFNRNEFNLSFASIDLSTAPVSHKGYQFIPTATLANINAHFNDALEVKADFVVDPWAIQHTNDWLPPMPRMRGQIVFQDAHLNINAQLFGKQPETGAQLNLQHWPELNKSHLKFELWPVDWQGQDNKLTTLLPGWPYPVGIASGQIQAAGELTLKWLAQGAPQVSGHLHAWANNLTGFVEDIYFSGLATDIDSQLYSDEASVIEVSGKLGLETIDVGLALTNIVLDYHAELDANLQNGILHLAEFSANLLGGSLSIPPVSFDLSELNHRFALELHNLSLGQLAEFGQYPGLELSGAINGQLPMQLSNQGVRIEQGQLEAIPPGGVIRYQQAAPLSLESVNPQLQLVQDVLQNFEYHRLKTEVNFDEQGSLLLAVQVQGANPDVAEGREIHLNLNLEDNITDLLRSMKMSREFSDFIQDRFSQDH